MDACFDAMKKCVDEVRVCVTTDDYEQICGFCDYIEDARAMHNEQLPELIAQAFIGYVFKVAKCNSAMNLDVSPLWALLRAINGFMMGEIDEPLKDQDIEGDDTRMIDSDDEKMDETDDEDG